MTFKEAKSKICPFMSARFNLSVHPRLNDFNKVYCVVSECMSFVVTKTNASLPSGSALYDIEGDELSFDLKEGFCKLLEVNNV